MMHEQWLRESRYVEALKVKSGSQMNYFVEEIPQTNSYAALRFCSTPGCESGAIIDINDHVVEAKAICFADYQDYYRSSENYNARGRELKPS